VIKTSRFGAISKVKLEIVKYIRLLLSVASIAACGCGSNGYSDFGLGFGVSQSNYVQLAPGTTISVSVAIPFIERNPGPIRVSWGTLPSGVSAAPTSLTFTATGNQSFRLSAAADSPTTPAFVPVTISGVAGSITHSETLYLDVGSDN
jgi:hypothetical protein